MVKDSSGAVGSRGSLFDDRILPVRRRRRGDRAAAAATWKGYGSNRFSLGLEGFFREFEI